MKSIIIYQSEHHGNTENLVLRMAEKVNYSAQAEDANDSKSLLSRKFEGKELTVVNVNDAGNITLGDYDIVGFASGIYKSKFGEKIYDFTEKCELNPKQRVFLMYTCGVVKEYTKYIAEMLQQRGIEVYGAFGCRGYDTYGPFKIVGGIAKKHPDSTDVNNAVEFYKSMKATCEK